jgi:anti-sigma-K factor RskA
MNDFDHDHRGEDIAAYLLGALEPAEAAELERHTDGCQRCQAEIRWMTPALHALPESIERLQPPPELRSRMMAEVRADAAAGDAAAREDRRSREPSLLARASNWLRDLGSGPMGRRQIAGVASAALVVLVVAGIAIGGGIGGSENGPEVRTFSTGHLPGVTATVVSKGDSGTLHLANIRQLPDDRVLEAWVQRNGDVEPVRALFVPDRQGRASTVIANMRDVDLVMVTSEPKGGTSAPTSSPIVSVPIKQ